MSSAVQSIGDGEAAEKASRSYREMLRSSAVVGGSQVVVMLLSVFRTKAVAVLLGPAGVGLMGLFSSILDLAKSVCEVGINSSGVRQIAASVGSADELRIARTITALRRTALVLAVLGASALVALAGPVAELTFGEEGRAGAVALLGVALALRLLSDAQSALLQGTRRIAELAKVNILGTAISTPAAVALVWFFGEDGVVPALVCIAGSTLAMSWWYSRRVPIAAVDMGLAGVVSEARALLHLGAAFMLSGFVMMGTAYAVRAMVVRMEGLEAAGFFQAAWALGSLYVGLVTQAMSADYCPRLTGIVQHREQANVLTNEQSRVSLLLAGPGIIATIAFAPVLMVVFYSSEFMAAAELLRWVALGMAMRIISWPIGYVIVARGDRRTFVLTELAWAAVNLGLSWWCLRAYGLEGVGIAFFASYVFHAVMIYAIVRRQTGLRWSSDNVRIAVVLGSLVTATCIGFRVLDAWPAAALACLTTVLASLYSLRHLVVLVAPHHLPAPVRRVIAPFARWLGTARA